MDGGVLYEGTGLNGQSSLRRVDLESGKVLQSVALAPEYFGEGVTTWRDHIIQLTWRSHVGFVYDKASFMLLQTFNYSTEGWGLTHDEASLIMSDGTSTLHFMDPITFQETKRITVTDKGQPVVNLNELEYVHGEILANVWQTDRIARIAPEKGLHVLADAYIQFRNKIAPHRALLEVVYSCGLRVSELVGLNWADIDSGLELVRVDVDCAPGGGARPLLQDPQSAGDQAGPQHHGGQGRERGTPD